MLFIFGYFLYMYEKLYVVRMAFIQSIIYS